MNNFKVNPSSKTKKERERESIYFSNPPHNTREENYIAKGKISAKWVVELRDDMKKTWGPLQARGRSPHWALPEERLLAGASEPRHLLQHNWEICSSCIPNWSRADGTGICLMKYVHSIKLGHWGFRTSMQSHCYPSSLETREVSGILTNLDSRLEREQC